MLHNLLLKVFSFTLLFHQFVSSVHLLVGSTGYLFWLFGISVPLSFVWGNSSLSESMTHSGRAQKLPSLAILLCSHAQTVAFSFSQAQSRRRQKLSSVPGITSANYGLVPHASCDAGTNSHPILKSFPGKNGHQACLCDFSRNSEAYVI